MRLWYAAHVSTKHCNTQQNTKLLLANLLGDERVYNPEIYKDKIVTEETRAMNMLPGYILVQLCDEEDDWSAVNNTNGVFRVMSEKPVDEWWVQMFKDAEDESGLIKLYQDYKEGDPVCVKATSPKRAWRLHKGVFLSHIKNGIIEVNIGGYKIRMRLDDIEAAA